MGIERTVLYNTLKVVSAVSFVVAACSPRGQRDRISPQPTALLPATLEVPSSEFTIQPPTVVLTETAPTAKIPKETFVGMWFTLKDALEGRITEDKICANSVIGIFGDALLKDGKFDSTILDKARECGVGVIVRLGGLTRDLAKKGGGFDLEEYERRIRMFAGHIDPYVKDGTIFAHEIADEPENKDEWNGKSPTDEALGEAARKSKELWPTLPTMINTTPVYALRHQWEEVDIINFTYGVNKKVDINEFIRSGVEVLLRWPAKKVSWTVQVVEGGSVVYGERPMSQQQVYDFSVAMCDAGGLYLTMQDPDGSKKLTAEQKLGILNALVDVREYCER